jgi:hypothetical protein
MQMCRLSRAKLVRWVGDRVEENESFSCKSLCIYLFIYPFTHLLYTNIYLETIMCQDKD